MYTPVVASPVIPVGSVTPGSVSDYSVISSVNFVVPDVVVASPVIPNSAVSSSSVVSSANFVNSAISSANAPASSSCIGTN